MKEPTTIIRSTSRLEVFGYELRRRYFTGTTIGLDIGIISKRTLLELTGQPVESFTPLGSIVVTIIEQPLPTFPSEFRVVGCVPSDVLDRSNEFVDKLVLALGGEVTSPIVGILSNSEGAVLIDKNDLNMH